MRSFGSRSLVLILALLVAPAAALSAPGSRAAGPTSAQRAARAQKFKKPFRRDLPRIGDGALVTLRGKAHLSAAAYRDISRAVQHLLRKYPADSHYFIGLGRDPAPIIAFLQNLGGKDLAINFPASSNNSNQASPQIMAEYVKRLVPEEVLTSGRTIVFVDATTSGRGLDHYVPLITPSLKGARVIKAAFAVEHNGSRNYKIFTNPGDKQVIDTRAFPEVNRFFTDPYEDVVSEYPRHVPGKDPMSALDSPLPQYKQFRDALMQRMERDTELHQFLESEGGSLFGD